MSRWHHERRPPWWPGNEPWPPPGRARGGEWMRRAFLFRVGGVFVFALIFGAVGLARFFGLVGERAGFTPRSDVYPLAVFAFFFVVIFFGGMRRVGLPLGSIVDAAERVGRGDYSTRIIERGPPFLQKIARAFNAMTTRLEAQERQRRDLMADVAHELRTPLSVMRGRLEGLLDGVYERDDATIEQLIDETKLLGTPGRGLADAGARRRRDAALAARSDRPRRADPRRGDARSKPTRACAGSLSAPRSRRAATGRCRSVPHSRGAVKPRDQCAPPYASWWTHRDRGDGGIDAASRRGRGHRDRESLLTICRRCSIASPRAPIHRAPALASPSHAIWSPRTAARSPRAIVLRAARSSLSRCLWRRSQPPLIGRRRPVIGSFEPSAESRTTFGQRIRFRGAWCNPAMAAGLRADHSKSIEDKRRVVHAGRGRSATTT